MVPGKLSEHRRLTAAAGIALALLAIAVTLWAYRPALDADFVLDDITSVYDNPALFWETISWDNVRGVLESSRLKRRAVANISFALNFVVGGIDPFGFHLVNVLIHLGMGCALALLIRLYLKSTARSEVEVYGLAALALPVAWFLLHPLNTQAVTYVVQRMTSLSALFAVLSVTTYLAGRMARLGRKRTGWWVAAVVFLALGLRTKENVALVPFVLLAYEWCFHRDYWRERWRAIWNGAPRNRAALLAVAVAVVGLVTFGVLQYVGGNPFRLVEPWPRRDFNGLERMLTQTRVHWLYLSLLVWPSPNRLNLDHDFSISRGLLDPPSTLFALLGLLAVLAGVFYLAARRPRVGFPLLAYFMFHAAESGPVSLEMVFEHRMYLPIAMLALALAVVLQDLKGRWRAPILVAATLYVAALATATHARNETWSDPVRLAEDVARKSPLKRRAQTDLGIAYRRAGLYEKAEEALLYSLELDPYVAGTHYALAVVYLDAGRPGDARGALNEAVRLKPNEPRFLYAIGEALEDEGRTAEAFDFYMGLGARYGTEGRAFPAIEPLRRAVRIQPENSAAHNALGNVYSMAEMSTAAIEEYRRAVELNPENSEAVYNLATLLDREGMRAEALDNYRLFVEVAPPGFADYVRQAEERVRQIEADVP